MINIVRGEKELEHRTLELEQLLSTSGVHHSGNNHDNKIMFENARENPCPYMNY